MKPILQITTNRNVILLTCFGLFLFKISCSNELKPPIVEPIEKIDFFIYPWVLDSDYKYPTDRGIYSAKEFVGKEYASEIYQFEFENVKTIEEFTTVTGSWESTSPSQSIGIVAVCALHFHLSETSSDSIHYLTFYSKDTFEYKGNYYWGQEIFGFLLKSSEETGVSSIVNYEDIQKDSIRFERLLNSIQKFKNRTNDQ